MKISLVTNNMGISDKLRFRHHILSLMLGLPIVPRLVTELAARTCLALLGASPTESSPRPGPW